MYPGSGGYSRGETMWNSPPEETSEKKKYCAIKAQQKGAGAFLLGGSLRRTQHGFRHANSPRYRDIYGWVYIIASAINRGFTKSLNPDTLSPSCYKLESSF